MPSTKKKKNWREMTGDREKNNSKSPPKPPRTV